MKKEILQEHARTIATIHKLLAMDLDSSPKRVLTGILYGYRANGQISTRQCQMVFEIYAREVVEPKDKTLPRGGYGYFELDEQSKRKPV
jgi:hypothetical protein